MPSERTRSRTRTLRVDALARVEGEGAMHVRVRDGHVTEVALRIYEPPRFFEALLRGRAFEEPADITARICGICPVAYQMSAVHALEDIAGVTVDGPLRDLRRLLYCGEWIESHALHVYLLHAPDFLGYAGGLEMARDHPDLVERGLRLKQAGNAVMVAIGGREIHPVNVRVGGFHRVPGRRELEPLAETLRHARDDALETVRWVAGFDLPDHDLEHEFVAVREPGEYPVLGRRVVSTGGLDIPVSEYDDHFVETHVSHSTALHSRLRERGTYVVGPLARYALSHDDLTPLARQVAAEAGLGTLVRNPFQSITVRAVEMVHACDVALDIIERYQPPDRPAVPVEPRAGIGYGVSEAPRGLLYHRYRVSADGSILDAKIVPPTSQNQRAIEEDLRAFVEEHLRLPDEELGLRCEQVIRSYDPCISCATHFLHLEVERE